MNLNNVKLSNGLTVREMTYKQNNRTKRLLIFAIIAVIISALAFTACFLALEISKTNAYNKQLHNSIITQPNTDPETPPVIDPNNSTGSGSDSADGETGLSYSGAGILIETRWFSGTGYNFCADLESDRLISYTSKNEENALYITAMGAGWSKISGGGCVFSSGNSKDPNNAMFISKNLSNDNLWIKFWCKRSDSSSKFLLFEKVNGQLRTVNWQTLEPDNVHLWGNMETSWLNGDLNKLESYETNNVINLVKNLGENEVRTFYLVRTERVIIDVENNSDKYLTVKCSTREITTSLTDIKEISIRNIKSIATYLGVYNFLGSGSCIKTATEDVYYIDYAYVEIENSIVGSHITPIPTGYTYRDITDKIEGVCAGHSGDRSSGYTYSFASQYNYFPLNYKLGKMVRGYTKTITGVNPWDIIWIPMYEIRLFDYVAIVNREGVNYYCGDEVDIQNICNTTITAGSIIDLCFETNNFSDPIKINNTNAKITVDAHFYLDNLRAEITAQECTISSRTTFSRLDIKADKATVNGKCTRLSLNITNSCEVTSVINSLDISGGTVYAKNNVKITNATIVNSGQLRISTNNNNTALNVKVSGLKTDSSKLVLENASNYPSIITIAVTDNSYIGDDYLVVESKKKLSFSTTSTTQELTHGLDAEIVNTTSANPNGWYHAILKVSNVEKITSAEDLRNKTFVSTQIYQLQNDIEWTGDTPITKFVGTLDGNGFSINFKNSAGLFKEINDATIKDLILYGTVNKGYSADGVNNYFTLAYKATSSNDIYNLYTIAKVGVYSDSGPASSLIIKNSGTLNFTNCNVASSPEKYISTGKSSARSCYVGICENSNSQINFTNCVAPANINFDNTEFNGFQANGIFVGTTSSYYDLGATGSHIKFSNCYYKYNYGSLNAIECYNPLVGSLQGWHNYADVYTNVNEVYTLTRKDGVFAPYNSFSEIDDLLNNLTDPKYKDWTSEGYLIVKVVGNETGFKQIANGTTLKYRAVSISNDITLNNWSGFEKIEGIIDGKKEDGGYCTITFGTNCSQGITNELTSDGIIRYLNIKGEIEAEKSNVGGIAGLNKGEIKNCTTTTEFKLINSGTYNFTGGIVGRNENKLSNCINNGYVEGDGSYIGGIAGASTAGYMIGSYYYHDVNNINNKGTVKGTGSGCYLGGVFGYLGKLNADGTPNTTITDGEGAGFYYYGDANISATIEHDGSMQYIGGFIGYIGAGSVISTSLLSVTIKITSTGGSYIGGVAGYSAITLSDFTFSGTITCTNSTNIGGICGAGNVENCKVNEALDEDNKPITVIKVTTEDDTYRNVAGITWSGTATNCTFNGNIEIIASDGVNDPKVYLIGFSLGKATGCTFIGNIVLPYHGYFYYFGGDKDSSVTAENCLFIGSVKDKNDNPYVGAPFVFNRKIAKNCYAQNLETKIVTGTENGQDYITENCSYFKDYTTYDSENVLKEHGSIVWNGSRLSRIDEVFLTSGSKQFEITDVDQLNALINIIGKNIIENEANLNEYIFNIGEIDLSDKSEYYLTTNNYLSEKHFTTEFEGLGTMSHKIDGGTWIGMENCKIELSGYPLFKYVKNATIQNLTAVNKSNIDSETGNITYTTTSIGLIYYAKDCIITNCINNADITITSDITTTSDQRYIGGIVSRLIGGTIEQCSNYGQILISASMSNVGGVIATSEDADIKLCNNYGDINIAGSIYRLGGIAGELESGQISECYNEGDIDINETVSWVGGIVGESSSDGLTKCVNKGNISTTKDAFDIGGIVGSSKDKSISQCVNYGNISNNNESCYIGGIVASMTGASDGYLNINTCENYGDILQYAGYAGGIVADITYVNIENCYSYCVIESGYDAGGIVGHTEKNVSIKNCITDGVIKRYEANTSNISVDSAGIVAGIHGEHNIDVEVNIINCVSFMTLKTNKAYGIANGYNIYNKTLKLNIKNCYFFGELCPISTTTTDKGVISINNRNNNVTINVENCGYNINNKEEVNNNGATLVYVKNDNPVWSTQAYIKILFKTETDTILDDDVSLDDDASNNSKLELAWADTNTSESGVQSGFDTTFWADVLNFA